MGADTLCDDPSYCEDASMNVGESVVGLARPSATLALTYDDGPTPGVTDALLDALADARATATFFVLLSRVRRAPGLLREVLDAGHEIGLHGLDHRRLTHVPASTLPALMNDGRRELEDVSGVEVEWFRPPYGAQSRASWKATRDAGMTPVMWSVACRDWLTLTPDEYTEALRESPLDGELLLLHDGFADQCDGVDDGVPPRLDRVRLLRSVLELSADAGVRCRSLSDASAAAGVRLDVRLTPQPSIAGRVRRALKALT
jgi:peptidoglycan/xylan/chitin deacetylase (PgdA/CDA1 family)